MTYAFSYAACAAIMYLEVSPRFNTNTFWRKVIIFALLIAIVAKG